MPTIQHITSMERRARASGGNAGTRTVLDVDFGSVPRSSGSVTAILENSSIGDTVLASVLAGPYTGKGTLADETEWVWDANQHTPIVLQPGQLLALRNPVAMDAAGTWQFSITVDYYEL